MSIHTVPIGASTSTYGPGSSSQPIVLEDVICLGTEDNITQCNYTENTLCSHHLKDVGVICEGIYVEI